MQIAMDKAHTLEKLYQYLKCLWNEKTKVFKNELIWKAFQEKKGWCFSFFDIFSSSRDIQLFS